MGIFDRERYSLSHSVKTLGDAARNLWPLVDHLGTVRDLAKQDGTIAAHYKYDSFGRVTSGDTSKTRYLFTSREFDPATGLQYNRARWYDPRVGRWLSEDPLGFVAGDGNVARYVGNEPTRVLDPNGMQPPDVATPGPGTIDSGWVWPWNPRAEWWFGIPNPFGADWWNERIPVFDHYGAASSVVFGRVGQGPTRGEVVIAVSTTVLVGEAIVVVPHIPKVARIPAPHMSDAEYEAAVEFFRKPVPSIRQPGALPPDYRAPWYPGDLIPGTKPIFMDPPLYKGPFPRNPGPGVN